jgi:hypothetical protein
MEKVRTFFEESLFLKSATLDGHAPEDWFKVYWIRYYTTVHTIGTLPSLN